VSNIAERSTRFFARPARREDAAEIARIYNEGIEDRVATFETDLRTERDVLRWFEEERTILVVEGEGRVAAFASAFAYRPRACYRGVREFSVYVSRDARGRGLGRLSLESLIETARSRGDWKLLSRVFPENKTSLNLLASLGFRQVGTYIHHARLDGVWRDVVIVEKLIDEAAAGQ
jgi:L-amino acid N-acyltransferase YncA